MAKKAELSDSADFTERENFPIGTSSKKYPDSGEVSNNFPIGSQSFRASWNGVFRIRSILLLRRISP